MDTSVIVAAVSGACAVLGVALSYWLTKRREREAEWRKLKLEHYREFVQALSGVAGHRRTMGEHLRYRDAVNNMTLVAPGQVLRALYSFQDEIRFNNANRSSTGHDRALTDLFKAIRRDVNPHGRSDKGTAFRIMDIPPTCWIEADIELRKDYGMSNESVMTVDGEVRTGAPAR